MTLDMLTQLGGKRRKGGLGRWSRVPSFRLCIQIRLSLRAIALHGIYESNFIIIIIDNKLFNNNNDKIIYVCVSKGPRRVHRERATCHPGVDAARRPPLIVIWGWQTRR
jgi:hypothetical protein